jgi:hypothetical protein
MPIDILKRHQTFFTAGFGSRTDNGGARSQKSKSEAAYSNFQ